MARKTFISYKYSESKSLRNRIISALREDAEYYQGETSNSEDMSDKTNQRIAENLKNMIFDTSVTIVILSPQMKKSRWMHKRYCCRNQKSERRLLLVQKKQP